MTQRKLALPLLAGLALAACQQPSNDDANIAIDNNINAAEAAAADVVRTRMFITYPADADAIGAVHGEVFGTIRPAATMVVVSALLRREWRIEIEAEALVGDDPA